MQKHDKVVATDPTSGVTEAREVDAIWEKASQRTLVVITVDVDGAAGSPTEVITSTDEHPFWVEGEHGGWVKAVDLKPGDDLRSSDGSRLEIVRTAERSEYRKVYNLTVRGLHTYYVLAGEHAVLTHNCDGPVKLYGAPHKGVDESNGLHPANFPDTGDMRESRTWVTGKSPGSMLGRATINLDIMSSR